MGSPFGKDEQAHQAMRSASVGMRIRICRGVWKRHGSWKSLFRRLWQQDPVPNRAGRVSGCQGTHALVFAGRQRYQSTKSRRGRTWSTSLEDVIARPSQAGNIITYTLTLSVGDCSHPLPIYCVLRKYQVHVLPPLRIALLARTVIVFRGR